MKRRAATPTRFAAFATSTGASSRPTKTSCSRTGSINSPTRKPSPSTRTRSRSRRCGSASCPFSTRPRPRVRDTFPDQLDALLSPCRRSAHGLEAVEITRPVRSPRFANDQGLVFMLYRLAGLLGTHRDVRMILSCVRHNHVPFYLRLQHCVVAGPKNYSRLTCSMYILSCIREGYDAVRGRFPLMDSEAFPQDDVSGFLAGQPMTTQIRSS